MKAEREVRPTAEAEAYVRGILERLGGRDPMSVLAELVPWLRDRLAGVPDAALRRPEAPGKWSLIEVVRHLADSELVYRYRMRMIVAQPEGPIPAYDQDRWAEGLSYRSENLEETLRELSVLRDADLAWLGRLTEEELDRWGVHGERGRESVRGITRLLAGHDLVHRAQVERILEAVG